MQIARTFREKNIPCDVIWMDIDYMDGFRCFTFDKANPPSLTFTKAKFTVYYLHSFRLAILFNSVITDMQLC